MKKLLCALGVTVMIAGCKSGGGDSSASPASDYSGEQSSAPAKLPIHKATGASGAPSASGAANAAVPGVKPGK